jgi:arylsulfatase A-like enzyme
MMAAANLSGIRMFLRVVCLLLTCLVPTALRAEEKPQRLNVVLLCTDDQRFDTLGCTGNKIIQTPHVDALARRGLVFDNSFVTTSICAISRASLFTGQYARRHGIHDFKTPLSPEQFALSYPGLLKKAGYRVGFIGKWGVGNELPAKQFDDWAGFGGQGRYFAKDDKEHLNRKMAGQALEFLKDGDPSEPFCLQVSFKAAHAQDGEAWEFPTEKNLRDLYANVHVPPPATATDQHFAALPAMLRTSEGRARGKPRFKTPELYQKTVKDYYRLITGADNVVGEIVQSLKEQGLLERTLIIFTSDNGYYLGDYGLADKWFMHEPSIRVPLVIVDPRLPADKRGKRVEELALNVDIAPTILGAAGVEAPATMQGLDLLSPALAKQRAARKEFYYEHPFKHEDIPQTTGVRGERFKYARYEHEEEVVEQLFDLRDDPHEERDLAGDAAHATELDHWRRRLAWWQKELQ